MGKPIPAFTLDDLDALLVEAQRIEQEEDRNWFAVRDLVGTWASSESGVQKRLRRLVMVGSVVPNGRRMLPGILDPQTHYSVPTYRVKSDEPGG